MPLSPCAMACWRAWGCSTSSRLPSRVVTSPTSAWRLSWRQPRRTMTDCVFCPDNWANLDIVERCMPVGDAGSVAIINPLNPVAPGHVLVIHRDHDDSAAASLDASRRAAVLMAVAADYVSIHDLQANIITSIGPDATQSVFHTHVHVVPRRKDDGLP